ncbi:zonular occludens toxin domain-containing protein [Microbulbifer sp. OS29]|uniref:Zonular occludens toxin domain-containing protein n=1 Tax=Microbulbifer okhotskensis TaxID=2926617 RepID=A0A9X2J729_9GAMM|nr:zonular occludens toxin domain-containing protein [Microbulbifer okhotskensis]MCO1336119.1 zonular occludens toxin domain-containing protein [Microbulbifer okhotskensis]
MLYLITGQIGASKTLNTIKMVNEDSAFSNRPVYYYNIKELSPRFGWTELTEQQCRNWFDLPPGSVIIIDEAYKIFPQRGPGQKKPPHVERMAELRHDAYEIILVAQSVKGQLDSFVRGLVNYHYHFVRPFGSEFSNRFFWEKCQENVDGFHEKREAQTKVIKFDKKYYGAYRSAEAHTVKKRLPYWKLGMFLGGIVGFVSLLFYLFSLVTGWGEAPDTPETASSSLQQTQQAISGQGGFMPAATRTAQLTTEDWVDQRTARVPGFALTAPVYDAVTQPVTFPKPNCVHWNVYDERDTTECRCYSQQATRMDVPENICLQIVEHGWFDHTRPDDNDRVSIASRTLDKDRERTTRPRYYPPQERSAPRSILNKSGDHLLTASRN